MGVYFVCFLVMNAQTSCLIKFLHHHLKASIFFSGMAFVCFEAGFPRSNKSRGKHKRIFSVKSKHGHRWLSRRYFLKKKNNFIFEETGNWSCFMKIKNYMDNAVILNLA